jgi:hypothetical protein
MRIRSAVQPWACATLPVHGHSDRCAAADSNTISWLRSLDPPGWLADVNTPLLVPVARRLAMLYPAAGMLALSLLQTIAGNHSFLVISTLGVKQRAIIMALLYQKSFSLSNAARQRASVRNSKENARHCAA